MFANSVRLSGKYDTASGLDASRSAHNNNNYKSFRLRYGLNWDAVQPFICIYAKRINKF